MRVIRPITAGEIEAFTTISANAYPGIDIFGPENRERFQERLVKGQENSAVSFLALFEDGDMRGVMRLYDFTMNLLSTRTLVGGVGGVDVSEFSSLVVGAIDFKKLYEFGLASISDKAYVEPINRLFAAPKPICLTEF